MLGTIVNVAAVVIGTIIGCVLKHAIPKKIQDIIMQAIGLGTVTIGVASAIKTQNPVLFIISLALGASIGKTIGIENGLEKIGDKNVDFKTKTQMYSDFTRILRKKHIGGNNDMEIFNNIGK